MVTDGNGEYGSSLKERKEFAGGKRRPYKGRFEQGAFLVAALIVGIL